MRTIVVLVVLAALAVSPAPPVDARPLPGSRAEVMHALEVLHGWDARRARAWGQSDPSALRSLYLPGSSGARSDVRLLRSYAARGLVVRRMVTQVFSVLVIRGEQERLTIRVLDRIAGGEVEDGGRDVALPSTRPVLRRIEFRLVAGVWKVAAVTR